MRFSSDVPIQKESEDLLGRKDFAAALVRALRHTGQMESLIVGLFGGWGCGKTSIKNLVVRGLEKGKNGAPLIVQFNPWLVSRQEQLVEAFFRDITAAMSKPAPGESQEHSEKRLAKLASYLSIFGRAAEQGLDVLSVIGVPGAGLGAKVAKGVGQAGELAQQGAEAQRKLKEIASKTLAELKEDLRSTLNQNGRPVLIVIDDVDRLTREEICLLFTLIKGNADFPNFIYLVLCERGYVTAALNALSCGRGAEFLEKIVQVSFDVPQPDWKDLVRISEADWDSLLRSSKDAMKRSNSTRWNELIILAKPYLKHVRSLKRWMNAVRFSFGFFKRRGGFNANPEDVLAIELIRVFEPGLYDKLSSSKLELTYDQWDFSIWDEDNAAKRKAIKDSFLAYVGEGYREAIGKLMDWLFPNARWMETKEIDGNLLRDLRVADRRCFDRYFRLIVGKETLSRKEIKDAIVACRKPEEFSMLIRQEYARGRLLLLFEHLLAHADEIHSSALFITTALFEFGDELPDGKWTLGGSGIQGSTVSFLMNLLRAIPVQTDRSTVLFDALRGTTGVMLPFLVATHECYETYRSHFQENELIIPHSELGELKKLAVAKIEDSEESPVLCDANSFGFVLAIWANWSNSFEKPGRWLANRLATPNGLWQALRSAASTETSNSGTRYTAVDVEWLQKLVSLDTIDGAIAQIELASCDEDKATLLKLYQHKRRTLLASSHSQERGKAGDSSEGI